MKKIFFTFLAVFMYALNGLQAQTFWGDYSITSFPPTTHTFESDPVNGIHNPTLGIYSTANIPCGGTSEMVVVISTGGGLDGGQNLLTNADIFYQFSCQNTNGQPCKLKLTIFLVMSNCIVQNPDGSLSVTTVVESQARTFEMSCGGTISQYMSFWDFFIGEDGNGGGEWFKTGHGELSVNGDAGKLMAYPNPFSDEITLFSQFQSSGSVNYRLLDPEGREIAHAETENGTVKLTTGIQPAGVYLLEATGPSGERITQRLVSAGQ